jgi:hypothetical protein
MTTTFLFLDAMPARASVPEPSNALPSAKPAAFRKKSRRLKASLRVTSWAAADL